LASVDEISALEQHSTWISSATATDRIDGKSSVTVFAIDFDSPEALSSARLISTALGVYKAYLNGAEVTTSELLPGYTEYKKRQQVDSFDVTSLLRPGKNTLHLEVSDGWYKGSVGMMRATEQWGETVAVRALLQLSADGGSANLGTDETWRSRLSSHRADMIYGEFIDFRTDVPGQAEPVSPAANWQGVRALPETGTKLVAPVAPPVRVVESLAPKQIKQTPLGWLVDFGQNTAGWIRLSNLGPAGTMLRIIYGEALDNQGELTQENFKPDVPFLPVPVAAGQIDEVISAGVPGQIFEPKHSTKGFRYVRIEGLPGALDAEDICAQVVHTDLDRVGKFESSNEDLNWLHNATLWSFKSNVIEIPTDCPTRERAGWGADFDIFYDAASFLYNVDGFTKKWLSDAAVSIFENGAVANHAPSPKAEGEGGKLAFTNGSAGWGDSIISLPYKHYKKYADKTLLSEMWPTMLKWIAYVENKAKTERHPTRIATNEIAAEHEQYLWDTGFHFGEWLEPGAEVDFGSLMSADKSVIATAFYRKSTHELSVMAELLGKSEEAVKFAQLSANIKAAWQKEFLNELGEVQPATQANCARALSYDLLEESQKPTVVSQLLNLVHEAEDHLSTGFLATPILLPTLAENGQAELAFKILMQRDHPSWLSMKDQGATTIWERWQGYNSDGNPVESHNHYSKGAVISFLHKYVAGIKRASSESEFDWLIQPIISQDETVLNLDWVNASHETAQGPISVSWSKSNDEATGKAFALEVTVPVGARALVVLPNGQECLVEGGTHSF
jgi:alpha-L-rhamnosidase